jgi:hypothetical protein
MSASAKKSFATLFRSTRLGEKQMTFEDLFGSQKGVSDRAVRLGHQGHRHYSPGGSTSHGSTSHAAASGFLNWFARAVVVLTIVGIIISGYLAYQLLAFLFNLWLQR